MTDGRARKRTDISPTPAVIVFISAPALSSGAEVQCHLFWLLLAMTESLNESFSGVGSFFNELVELVHRAGLNDSFTNRTDPVKRLTDLVFINYF